MSGDILSQAGLGGLPKATQLVSQESQAAWLSLHTSSSS